MKYFLLAVLAIFNQLMLSAQVAEVEFGKNRVQYHDDFDQWLFYESENFVTYWYGKARNHGVSTVKLAEQDHDEIMGVIEHRINEKIEIIVYSDVTDLKQSNIGSDELFNTVAGQTKIEGNKVFVYFNGDHEHLRKQIRKGIATVFINNMFYGSNLQEVVQNSVAGAIPSWFHQGLSAYLGSYWDPYDDERLRNIFLFEKRTNFKKLSSIYPEAVGQSFWYYIGQTYGHSEISNLLYLTRINRNLKDAFLYVFGVPFDDLGTQWHKYFSQRYEAEKLVFTAPELSKALQYKRKKKVPVSHLAFNPAGDALAIVDNHISKTRVVIKELETGNSTKIFRHGYKNNVQATDFNYPMVSWLSDGSGLFILYEDRDQITIQLRDFEGGASATQILPERYERIYSMVALNKEELVFSALSEGMIDLFHYTTRTRQTNRITEDIYADLDITSAQIDGVDGILFSSNRPDVFGKSQSVDTTLPFRNFNLFHLAFESSGPRLYQITDQTKTHYRHPKSIKEGITYLSDENGIVNLKHLITARTPEDRIEYTLRDSVIMILRPNDPKPAPDSMILSMKVIQEIVYKVASDGFLTNNLWNILTYDVHPDKMLVADVYRIKNDYRVFLQNLNQSRNVEISVSSHKQVESRIKQNKEVDPEFEAEEEPIEEIIRSRRTSEEGKRYLFQTEYGEMATDQTERILKNALQNETILQTQIHRKSESPLDSQPINRLRIVPYRLKFRLHDLSTNMDNNLLFGGLDSYAAFKREFEPAPLGILMKANFRDLFEDYVFEGGVRIPTSFNGAEFFMTFDDRKKRLDRQYAFYRKSIATNIRDGNEAIRNRNIILLGQYSLRYPLDIYQSVRATATLRQDKIVILASDRTSLQDPDVEAQRLGLKLEYIFDNALNIDLNIRSGTRFKSYVELVKKFAFSFDPLSLKLSEGFMTVLGLDARQYVNFAKHMVWATRVAGGTSFGSEKILYFLGGSDNWLIPKFNQETTQPQGNFAYQAINPNLRGFDYNVRNGSTHAILNTELRIPFMKYLSRRPIKVSFIRHLQLVGFADMGAAWEGVSPFDEENPINIVTIENPPAIRLRVNYNRDPIVFGYGVGIRTVLFGYFLRLDYAWGVETRVVQEPKLHFSMGFDF